MRVYILKESDFETLRTAIVINPERVRATRPLSDLERAAHDEAHRFFNYQICNWIDSMKRDAP